MMKLMKTKGNETGDGIGSILNNIGYWAVSCDDAELNFSKFYKRTITFVLVPVEFLLMVKNNKQIGGIWAKPQLSPFKQQRVLV